MRWPEKIPANSTCSEVVSTLDILPTFAALAGTTPSPDRKIDGHNVSDLILGTPGAKSPHKAFYYYHTTQLQAVRSGKWKLVLPQDQKFEGWSGKKKDTPIQLYDLSLDSGEKNNLATKYPNVLAQLSGLAEDARRDLGDGDNVGKGQRKAGWVEESKPLLLQN
jgi:arylsulfatase A-like enzyme